MANKKKTNKNKLFDNNTVYGKRNHLAMKWKSDVLYYQFGTEEISKTFFIDATNNIYSRFQLEMRVAGRARSTNIY